MPVLLRVCAVMLLLVCAAARAEGSITPYDTLFTVLSPARQIGSFERLRAVQRIQSKTAAITPAQIRIVIKAKRGDIVVPIAADGRIDFPLDAALQTENPDVQSNQPKGSLSLTVTMELKLPDGARIGWTDLNAALTQAHDVLAAQARVNGVDAPGIVGAEFHFDPHSDAHITVVGKGERLLQADADGHVIVMLDEATIKEQPSLELTQKPLAVLPFLQGRR